MSFDEALATRIRRVLALRSDVTERRMFGGICFLVGGSMACGIVKAELCVRVGPDRYEEALGAPHTRPMDFTGRPLRGFVYVGAAGLVDSAALRKWLTLGIQQSLATPKRKRAPADATARRRK